MRLILLGPPGSGKGTQAKMLCERFNLAHIATGDELREADRLDTPAGRRARPFMRSGALVPDDVVNDIIKERFSANGRPERFVMDGYPRTAAQGVAFDGVLKARALPLNAVLLLAVDDEAIVERLADRRVCPNPSCKATYHLVNKPPKVAGVCDSCGTALVLREDDRTETVRERLRVYHQTTDDLQDYYRKQGLLREVPGTGDMEAIYQNIIQAIGGN